MIKFIKRLFSYINNILMYCSVHDNYVLYSRLFEIEFFQFKNLFRNEFEKKTHYSKVLLYSTKANLLFFFFLYVNINLNLIRIFYT